MPFPQNNHSYYLPMKRWIKRLLVFERVYIDCYSAYHSDRVFWALCLISMPHSMILLLCLQSCYLLMQRKRKSELLMDIFCVSSFIFTPQIECSECCVWFQRFTQWCCSCVSNVVPYWCDVKWRRVNCWWISFVSLLSFVFTQQIECSESLVRFQCFTQRWGAYIIDIAGCWCEVKSELLMDVFCVCLLLSSQLRSSFMSVVFVFSESLNDVAPVSPMWLPVYVMWNEEEWIVDGCLCVPSFVDTVQIELSECCVWFQCLTQWCCSCVSNSVVCLCDEKGKRVICLWMSFVCLLSFVFTTQI